MILVDSCAVRYLIQGEPRAADFFLNHFDKIQIPWVCVLELRRQVINGKISTQDFGHVLRFPTYTPVSFSGFFHNAHDFLKGVAPGSRTLRIPDYLVFRTAFESQAELATNDGDLRDIAEAAGLKVYRCNWC